MYISHASSYRGFPGIQKRESATVDGYEVLRRILGRRDHIIIYILQVPTELTQPNVNLGGCYCNCVISGLCSPDLHNCVLESQQCRTRVSAGHAETDVSVQNVVTRWYWQLVVPSPRHRCG